MEEIKANVMSIWKKNRQGKWNEFCTIYKTCSYFPTNVGDWAKDLLNAREELYH